MGSEVRAGQFVRSADNDFGVGKVVAVDGQMVTVEYFDSVAADGRVRIEIEAERVERTPLSLQRRCYWQHNGAWRVGRIVWQDAGRYAVRVPDSDVDLPIDEEDLFVRWDKPIDDPTAVLAAFGNESPHFHACRQPFVESVATQRAASRGMHGLLSSVVEIHNHQVEVARRVLEDPVQRYLLADEVGLGKTIEAGVIIRQFLLDNPDGHVVVITPPLLRRQWVAELREKFLIDDFDHAAISVLSHDNPESWLGATTDERGRTRSRLDADLVVVDEVHNLAALHSDESRRDHYAALERLAVAVPRLLLLSATPLLNNERTFLAMLHLLDPEVYDLEDVSGFEQRIAARRDLANTFFTMRPDTPAFLLKEKVESLRQLFPDDEELRRLLTSLETYVAEKDPNRLTGAVIAVRAHISETYRLHRRLLRNRRSGALLSTFPVRGRTVPEPIRVAGGAFSPGLDWLDDWRVYARSSLGDEVDAAAKATSVRCFVTFAERAASNVDLLKATARYRLSPSPDLAQEAELSDDEADALRRPLLADEERRILEAVEDLVDDGESLDALEAHLRSTSRRTVVFTSFRTSAQVVAVRLKAAFGVDKVATHITSDDANEVELALDRFRDENDPCRVLVCDRSAEEGRNLQFADAAIHFDLPLWPNRLEQRIGRLDRFGTGSAIPTQRLQYPTGSTTDAWADCLVSDFQVFNESLASLQFTVDEILPEVHEAVFDDGPEGLRAVATGLPDRLAAERLAVAEQDALDSVEEATYDLPLVEALEDIEDLWFGHQTAADDLLSQRHGNLRFHRAVDRSDNRFRTYEMTRPGGGANLNSMPLVAWDVLLTRFRPVVDRIGTFSRRSAVSRPGSRLFRVGEPLIDALSDYLRWDDRGQTFAMWRVSSAAGDGSAYFRFDYVVEADVERALELLRSHGDLNIEAIRRQVDAFLPPRTHTLWTDADGRRVVDPGLLAELEQPYAPDQGDFNLNADRRWALEQLVGHEWADQCRRARQESEGALRTSAEFTGAVAGAVAEFDRSSARRSVQREVRLRHLVGAQREHEEAELLRQQELDASLAAGITSPMVRVDSIGCIVLSQFAPSGPGFARQA